VPFKFPRILAASLATLGLVGCASVSPDGGFGVVAQQAGGHLDATLSYQRTLQDTDAAREHTAQLLAQPLSAATAVQIALLGNRELQARYGQLGLAEAERVRAATLPNPLLSLGRLAGGGVVEIDRALSLDVLGLFTLPLARQLGERQLRQAQWQAAIDTIATAAAARKAFYGAVAARQLADYAAQVADAADAASELAARMQAAGNFSRLERLREQAFAQQAGSQLTRARHQQAAAQERLTRALGLTREQGMPKLPERLPDLPQAPLAAPTVEQAAIDRRLDVQLARQAVEASADALGLSHATSVVNALEIGAQNRSATGEPLARGYEVTLALPLFDFGQARNARAQALYMQAVHRTAAVAQQARSEVREAWSLYQSSWQLARLQQAEVVPLGQQVSEEMVLRYNGMFASVFDLLADARRQAGAVMQAIEALRDFWIADTDLQSAQSIGLAQTAVPVFSTGSEPEAASAGH